MPEPLEALAARVANEPFFMAGVLGAYAYSEGLDDTGLAAGLGCAVQELTMLRLCRAPRSDAHEFWDDVTRIAERFGLDSQRLADVVKRGRVVLRFRQAEQASSGSLMAARDHAGEPPESPAEET